MKLIEMTVSQYAQVLASDAPAPGGGSASALCGAQGLGLLSMVCLLTVGKTKYAEHQALVAETQQRAQALQQQMLELIDRDTQAFDAVSAVFAMPRQTDSEKAARKQAMQSALKGCTLTPFEMMQVAEEGLRLVEGVQGKTNASAASDLGVAALNLKAAIQGAWLNVLINIGGIEDTACAEAYRGQGEEMLARALPLADRLSQWVEAGLK